MKDIGAMENYIENAFERQYYRNKKDPAESIIGVLILIFVLLALVSWAVLAVIRPTWCLSGKEANLDSGKAFGAALLISFIALLIIVLIWSITGGFHSEKGLLIALLIVIIILFILFIIYIIIIYNK